ncbi:unnamed protein product, partial [Mesorhabditis spiculigera]
MNGGGGRPLDPPYAGAYQGSIDQRSTTMRRIAPTAWEETSVEEISIKSLPKRQPREYSLLTKCVAEFLGDLTFVFVGTMQGFNRGTMDGTVHASLAHGFTIFIMVATLGHISGGHFNPAVTWSVAILTYDEAVTVQMGATLLLEGTDNLDNNYWWQGLIAETVVTFFLCHTILNTAVDTSDNTLAALAIGFTLSIDILAVGSITGASMNPARSFGPNVAASIILNKADQARHLWTYHYIYWAGPLLGASITAAIYRLFEARVDRLVK